MLGLLSISLFFFFFVTPFPLPPTYQSTLSNKKLNCENMSSDRKLKTKAFLEDKNKPIAYTA